MRRLSTLVLLLVSCLLLASCSVAGGDVTGTVPTQLGGGGASPLAATRPATPDPDSDAVDLAYDRLTPEQRVGQLFMVGVTTSGPTPEMLDALSASSGGNVFLRGGTDLGAAAVAAVTAQVATVTTAAGVRPFVSADQEGGNAQALQGEGFTDMPSGVAQGLTERTDLRADAQLWAGELRAAGVTLDLAPVGDVVPPEVGTANDPIGSFYREYGSDPDVAAPAVAAVVRGLQHGGVAATVKHFPGLGRATGNTDSDAGATDPTVRGDVLLEPFAKAVRAGVAFVMVSSAHYPAIDPVERACFSTVVLQDMVRGDLGFDGVIVSDSFGSASVAGTPPDERAVRFLTAGGTMVLDTDYRDLAPMTAAVLAATDADPSLAEVVERDVRLVLAAKERFGLLD